jgi:ABC-type lipoprotein export system ATPase subunit
MLQNPPVILMDEPTASLDVKSKQVVYNLLKVLLKDKTVVMVTHDPTLIKFADKAMDIQTGKVN